MRTILIFTILLFESSLSISQTDTTYFDKDWKNCIRKRAVYYRIIFKNGENYIVKDFFRNNILKMSAQCSSIEPLIKNGKCTNYDEKGVKLNTGDYLENKQINVWTWWYENGMDSLVGQFKDDGTITVLNMGHYINYREKKQFIINEGLGKPAVVFLSGLGVPQYSFFDVYRQLKRHTQIFAYDRSGVGNSERIGNQRTIDTMAFELHALLTKERVHPPYILVGHSMGAYIMRYFASQYPSEVAGLIFVDPATEIQFAEGYKMRTEEDKPKYIKECDFNTTNPNVSVGIKDEAKYIFDIDSSFYSSNGKIVREIGLPKNIPITIFLSTQVNSQDRYHKNEIKMRINHFKMIQKQTPQVKIIFTSKSGHFIQMQEPEIVIKEIMIMYKKTRTNYR